MFVLQKMRQKYKNKKKQGRKTKFKKKYIPKDLEIDEIIKQNKYLKNIGQRNKSNKIAKNFWLSKKKR